MTTKIKTLLVAFLACAAIGSYSITSAHEPSVGDRSVPMNKRQISIAEFERDDFGHLREELEEESPS